MYELMAAYWPTAAADPAATPAEIEFGRIWNATPKVVFSRTLAAVEGNSRLAGGDVVEELARLRGEHRGELAVGGPTLAAAFLERGLVDELRLAVHPVILGAGTPFLPPGLRLDLRLLGTRVFASGVIALRYAVDARPSA